MLKEFLKAEESRGHWWRSAPLQIRQSVKQLNGAFIKYLCNRLKQADMGFDDTSLHEACQEGFPFAGELPPIKYGIAEATRSKQKIEIEQLRASRRTNNEKILGAVTETEWRHGLVSGTDCETTEGWMTCRRKLEARCA